MNLAVDGAGRVEKSFFFLVGTPGLWPVKYVLFVLRIYVSSRLNTYSRYMIENLSFLYFFRIMLLSGLKLIKFNKLMISV